MTAKVSKVRKLDIEGFIPATYTPLDANGDLNLSIIPFYAAHLSKHKAIKAVFVNGTTGESVSLSLKERKLIVEEWVKIAPKYNLKVIAMVGTNSFKDSQALAVHAANLGVDAISCMSPSFFKPTTMDSLISFIKPIADSVPNTPFYYYHMPSLTHLHGVQQSEWNMFDMIRHIDEHNLIPNFVGLKYTGMYGTFMSFADLMNIIGYKNGKYEVFGGRDEMVLQLLSSGVKAFVGLSYNFGANIYGDIVEQFKELNIHKCRQIQRVSHQLSQMDRCVSVGKWGHKYLFCLSGVDVGDTRTPNVKLTEEDKRNLRRLAKQWNEKWKYTNTQYDIFQSSTVSKL
eukprot:319459_1